MAENKEFEKMVYCRRCENKTYHKIIKEYSIEQDEVEESYGHYWWERYIIATCMGCRTPCFINEYDDVSMHFTIRNDLGEVEEINLEDIKVYPPEPIYNKANQYKKVKFNYLPQLLETLYKQVIVNYDLKQYLLAAAGLRMIIEGICNDLSITEGYVIDEKTNSKKLNNQGQEVRSKSLDGKINGLEEKGLLTKRQIQILHIIRKLGNQTVHKLNNPKRKIIKDGLEIIEITFKNLYESQKYDIVFKDVTHN
ncbi:MULTISPECIES: DUF4145 domain-containing protein [Bacillus]|uniref:DUF4145 domain-containing protein n=1 Tax=Bacillus TaxID=1386 RepID=UPI002E1B531F|nr:DUF4145 domain-containing protein [Bacillus velezensis]